MINIVKNEFIKFFHKKSSLFLFIFMIIITLGFMTIVNYDSGNNRVEKESRLLDSLKKESSTLNEGEKKQSIDLRLNDIEKSIQYFNNLNDENFDWKTHLKEINSTLENSKTTSDSNIDSINTRIKMNTYLIENNIKPSSSYSVDSNDFLSSYMSILGGFLLFIIIAFFVSDCISSEYSNETIQLILLRPINKFKFILGKLLSNCIIFIGLILSFDLIAYLFSGLFFNFGNIKTPIFIYSKFTNSTTLNTTYNYFISPINNTSSFITYDEFIFKAILLQILFVICCVCFCTLISLLFKNVLTSTAICISIPIASLLISLTSTLNSIKKFFYYSFPFLGNSIDIVNQSIITESGAYFLSFSSVVLILFIWIVVLISLLYITKNKLKIN